MLQRLFIWWDKATMGTLFTLMRRGAKLVGKDAQGNRYFEEGGKPSFPDGGRRRWVVYHGVAEGSRVPADWHGWLHRTVDEPPVDGALPRQSYEKDHLPNMTGTPLAYHPKGSLFRSAKGFDDQEVYKPWSPDGAEAHNQTTDKSG